MELHERIRRLLGEHGMIDRVVHRHEMRETLTSVLSLLIHKRIEVTESLPAPEADQAPEPEADEPDAKPSAAE